MTIGPGAQRLGVLDGAFLNMETRDTPMHVASLQIYSLPPGEAAGFIRALVQRFRSPRQMVSPWNLKLADVPLSRLAPAVVPVSSLDFDYHVRHAALPEPGGERELGELVSHLHGVVLDRSRPLWTCHIIEGLQDGRFAIYLKIHHALSDGVRGLRMIRNSLSASADADIRPPWECGEESRPRQRSPQPDRIDPSQWPDLLSKALSPLISKQRSAPDLVLPFEAPRTALNGAVTNARRVATQSLEVSRLKRLAEAADASMNDVFLAICATALRRHLLTQSLLPKRPLVAAVPVSLRQEGDVSTANAVGFVWATLGTDIEDPVERLAAIRRSMEAAKLQLKGLPPQARLAFTTIAAAPATLLGMLGLASRFPPAMNLVISNVPGPECRLHLGKARLEALYPMSIPIQGQALNITCVRYGEQLDIGFVGSRDQLPHLQRLSVYSADALDELEGALWSTVVKRPKRSKASGKAEARS